MKKVVNRDETCKHCDGQHFGSYDCPYLGIAKCKSCGKQIDAEPGTDYSVHPGRHFDELGNTYHATCPKIPMPEPSSSTPASPPTEQPALTHLLEVAARIVRREYLPTLESCKNIGQARALIARYDAMHAALGMELKSIFDNLASVRAASESAERELSSLRKRVKELEARPEITFGGETLSSLQPNQKQEEGKL